MGVRSHWWLVNIAALAVSCLAGWIYSSQAVQRLEFSVADQWFKWRGALPAPDEVVVAAIDDESLEHLGLSLIQPIPREKQADLITRLKEAGSRVVVFDLLFQGAGPNPEADRRLARAFEEIPSVIASDVGWLGAREDSPLVKGVPLDLFSKSAKALGRYLSTPDFGVMRRFQLEAVSSNTGAPLHSLAQAATDLYGRKVQATPALQDLINFYGPAGTVAHVPFHLLLEGRSDALQAVKDKIVFVGSYQKLQSGLITAEDSFFTPYHQMRTFGVEIHATMAANLIRGDWIRRFAIEDERRALIVIVFLLCITMLSLKPYWSFLILAAIDGVWGLSSYHLFEDSRLFIPGLFATLLVFPLIFLLCTLYYYVTVYRVQKRTRLAFARYLSPAMVDSIVDLEKKPELGGETAEVTLLFTDIAGFTHWAENVAPQEMCASANQYFTEIGKPVLESGGTLIKFLGDGMFVLWGAPLPVEQASDKAVKSALEIQQIARRLKDARGLSLLSTRIGIHRGTVVVGNFGSATRFDYTAIGDPVNTASRLEGLNKQFGTSIILSESVAQDLKSPFNMVPLGKVIAAGKEEALEIFTVFPTELDASILVKWIGGLDAFARRDWQNACDFFADVASNCEELERASELYRRSIAKQQQRSQVREWDGTLVFDVK